MRRGVNRSPRARFSFLRRDTRSPEKGASHFLCAFPSPPPQLSACIQFPPAFNINMCPLFRLTVSSLREWLFAFFPRACHACMCEKISIRRGRSNPFLRACDRWRARFEDALASGRTKNARPLTSSSKPFPPLFGFLQILLPFLCHHQTPF